MENKIFDIKIKEIANNPLQKEIYGEIEIDEDFLLSIKDRGIIQPLLITDTMTFGADNKEYSEHPHTIIAGHRRLMAAKEADFKTVPCQIKLYENEAEATLDFLSSNKFREKNDYIRRQEYLAYYQKLCHLGKLRQGSGLYTDTIFENEEFCHLVKTLKIEKGKPLNLVEILQNITGFSKHQQDYLKVIYSDPWLEGKLEKWRKLGIQPDDEDKVWKVWKEVREKCDNKTVTFRDAHDSLNELVKKTEKALEKKTTKSAKISIDKPKTQNPKPKLDLDKLAKFPVKPIYFDEKEFDKSYKVIFYKEKPHHKIGLAYLINGDHNGSEPFVIINKIVFLFSWLDLVNFAAKIKVK
jgi:hypothetical protein